MLGAALAMLAMLAPAVDCSLVFRVSSGNRATVETQEAMPPASAAVSSILPVRFSWVRSEGGGPGSAWASWHALQPSVALETGNQL